MLLSDAAESASSQSSVWVFGNEARGLPEEIQAMSDLIQVGIPMRGRAESLNLATAAAVVMYALAEKKK
jgi:TrmH family RNA methyltransferase